MIFNIVLFPCNISRGRLCLPRSEFYFVPGKKSRRCREVRRPKAYSSIAVFSGGRREEIGDIDTRKCYNFFVISTRVRRYVDGPKGVLGIK